MYITDSAYQILQLTALRYETTMISEVNMPGLIAALAQQTRRIYIALSGCEVHDGVVSHAPVPITVFAKGAFFARHEIGQLACSVVGLDWNMDPAESRELIPNKVLQGNLDPCVLYADFAQIRAEVKQMFDAFGHQHYIANLGHGIYPDTDPDKARCFVDAVKELGSVWGLHLNLLNGHQTFKWFAFNNLLVSHQVL